MTSYSAVTPAECEAVMAELPPAIASGLSDDLHRESVVLRYDVSTGCAYYIARRKWLGLVVWMWSDLEQQSAADLLSSLADIDQPMNEELALQLAQGRRM